MRVNIISNFKPHTGLSQDVGILRGILTAVFDKDVEIRGVQHVQPYCDEAEYNIFVEVINPSLFSFARKNVWIPNIEWVYKTWEPYMSMVDEIWVKTKEAEKTIKALNPSATVRYIGWTSVDKVWNPDKDKKNYHKAIVPIGRNIYRGPHRVFQAYMRIKELDVTLYNKLPTLNVVHNPESTRVDIPEQIASKVVLLNKHLREGEYDDLLKECGICICMSVAEGFGHAVNEAMSAGCIQLLSPISPFKDDMADELCPGVFYGNVQDKMQHPDCMALMVDTSVESIIEGLKDYVELTFKEKRKASEAVRSLYEKRHNAWVDRMKSMLVEALDKTQTTYTLNDAFVKEEELPDISIVTLTKDRRIFMPLAKYCYLIQSYPEDKLEWVIVDDGEDSIEDTLIGIPNVTYVRAPPGLTIAGKRNLGVEKAMYDVVAMMDDDDIYPENSILYRAAMMLKAPRKECAFACTIPCYDICKYISFINVPPMTLPMSHRTSEATFIFTRKFWEEGKFDNSAKLTEGDAFIRGREHMCRELCPRDVIVALSHPLQSSMRKAPDMKEPNGCHYGFNEKLFTLVTEIGQQITSTSTQTASGGASTCATPGASCETTCDGGDVRPQTTTHQS
jgi:hypothetical protein